MKKIVLFSALALSSISVFANFIPARAEAKFTCQATFNRVLINAEGEALYTITYTATASNCFDAMAIAQAHVNADTPFWKKFWRNG